MSDYYGGVISGIAVGCLTIIGGLGVAAIIVLGIVLAIRHL